MTTRQYVEVQLTSHQIQWQKLADKILIVPDHKPENMTWGKWQILLKYVSLYNQKDTCICGQYLRNQGELHHAIFSRKDVMGTKENRHLIHHPFNVIVLCKDCHINAVRNKCMKHLIDLYGEPNLRMWYDGFPTITTKIKFDWFLE